MPPLQTTIPNEMAAGMVGRRQNMEEWNGLTGLAEDVTANPIGFAQPVMRGTAGEQVKKYDGAGVFRGITEADVTLGADTYPEGYNTPVMESGVIWALAGGACTAGGPVYWAASTGRYSDTNTDTLIPNAEFDSAAAADGDLVKIRLRRIPAAP
ncbi:structural cement protein Gp24 [Nitratireductor sp. GCM10026969]|uniref:structural cement protein Gp24 n=1 Tax=Nitratireductor sp. GCM10026969 TaxID=3252645 RepID=UPI00362309E8